MTRIGGIDFTAHNWLPVVGIPAQYDVLDLSGSDPMGVVVGGRTSEWSIGRYDEKRACYTTELFGDSRVIHVGIDIGGPIGTPVMAFSDGEISHFGYNPADGDYGHTIITKHQIDGVKLWALYGHLDENSTRVAAQRASPSIKAGEVIGWFGAEHENGGWPPHLHFQLSFIEPQTHDLPGVVSEADREQALRNFPDPQLILGKLY